MPDDLTKTKTPWRAVVQTSDCIKQDVPGFGDNVTFLASEGTLLGVVVGRSIDESTWETSDDNLYLRAIDGQLFVESTAGRLSPKVVLMLNAQKKFFDAFKEHARTTAPGKMRSDFMVAMVDDRRDMYWRLADEGRSLVYSYQESCDPEKDPDMFVDDVHLVWRPEGESFVVAMVDTGLSISRDLLAVLLTSMERPVS